MYTTFLNQSFFLIKELAPCSINDLKPSFEQIELVVEGSKNSARGPACVPDSSYNWALVSEPGFSDFQISRFRDFRLLEN